MPKIELFYITYERCYGVHNPPNRKNDGDFCRFSLAVIAIENDDECRKQNFSISPIYERSYGQAEKNDFFFFFVEEVFRFRLAVIAIENDDECRKQNFYLAYERSYGVPNPLSRKKENFCRRIFRFNLAVIAIENDDECRKQTFSISHMSGTMVCITHPAEKITILQALITLYTVDATEFVTAQIDATFHEGRVKWNTIN